MHPILSIRLIRIIAVIIPAIVLTACGGSGGDDRDRVPSTLPEVNGTLVDSPVSGVFWAISSGASGLTNDSGEFPYRESAGTFSESVTFSIGDIVLGTAPVAPYITAVELTNSFSPTDRAATNQLVFLQSIDADQDPTNGITVSEATRAAAVGVFDSLDFDSLDFDSPDFDEQVVQVLAIIAPGNEVVTDTQALDHFYTTYAALGGTDTFDFLFPGYPPVGEDAEEFRLVFADEFDEGFVRPDDGRFDADAPDPAVWNIDQGYGPNDFGWGNDEWQLYTASADNLRVEDGNLVITALCPEEPCGSRDGSITSARITTNDKREDFRYGKVVARIKPPVGQGTWPAFWALGKNFPEVSWPRVGEIDFMEVYNNTNNDSAESDIAERTATSAIHWCDETNIPPTASCFTAGGRRFITDKLTLADSLGDDFQIWEADWTPDKITVSINGVKYFEQEFNVTPAGGEPRNMEEFRRDFFLLLNVAMGGTLGSGRFDSGLGRFVVDPPQGDETFPQTMLVDYVRVYERVDDISPPELTEVTIASDNADPRFATTGDVVTITLTASEPIDTPVVTIGGIPATTISGSGAMGFASRTWTAADADGVIEFTVEYADRAGNDGVPVSETTDSSSVTADSTAPTLTTVTIASDNPNPGLATTGDTIEVTLAADEAIMPPVVTISGFAVIPVGSGANWTASRTVMAGDPEGEVTFSIDYADFAGNSGVTVSESTDSSSVIVSITSATVTIVGAPATFNTLAPIPLSFEFSKPVTGFDLNDIQVTNGAAGDFDAVDGDTYTANVTPTGIGNLVIGVPAGAAADAAGSPSEAADDVVVTNDLDTDAPVLSVVSITSNNLNPGFARTGEEVTISLTASENILEPVVTIAGGPANVTPGADATSWVASRTALASDPEGPIAFTINFEDLTGNPGPESTVTTDGSVVIFDVTEPTLSIDGLPATLQFLDPLEVTFQFGEDVSGFELADIDVTNGTVDAFAVVDADTYTADITPDPDAVGDLTVAVAAAAAKDAAGNDSVEASEDSVVGSAWGLVWSDDFEADGLDTGLWTARTDADCDPDTFPCDGVQSYLTERVTVEGGLLTIEARDEGVPGYTSGVIDTSDNPFFNLTYGRVEIDAIMPGTQGTLPSLRLLPAIPGGELLPVYGPFPQSGEIDLLNAPNLGPLNSTLEHTLRYGLPEPEDTVTTATSEAPGVPTVDVIEYAIEWEGGEIRWFVNDVHVATQTQDNWYAYFEDAEGIYTLGTNPAPFDQDFFVVIGLAVGSDADSFFPQTLEIDEVRVYECVNSVGAGIGCSTGTGVPPVVAPSAPYVETIEVYIDEPETLPFVEPDGTPTPGTLAPAALGDATFSQPSDNGNIVWRVNVTSSGGVSMSTGAASRYIDLSGGDTAGEIPAWEILFRMRVNSADAGVTQIAVGLDDRDSGTGRDPLELDFVVGEWRDYSVKIADVLANSVAQSSSLDLADISNIFVLQASGGAVNLDLDDISVKVACRDDGACEATPRAESSVPATVVYEEDFEGLNAADPLALGGVTLGGGAGFLIFADVWDGPVGDGLPLYSYGAFPAPNPGAGPGFSQLINNVDECFAGGGTQCLNAFSDYNNQDHLPGRTCGTTGGSVGCNINTNVLYDIRSGTSPITAADIGLCWTFTGDYKAPGVGGIDDPASNATANAFITTLDPNAGFAATNVDRFDTTAATNTDYASFSVVVDTADSALIGQILQIGFNTTATNFEPSGIYYDNLEVSTRPGVCPEP